MTARGKTAQTEHDMRLLKCRWVKQQLHGELDALREECAALGQELPIDLEVEGGLVQAEEESATLEAEKEAAAVLQAVRADKQTKEQGLAQQLQHDDMPTNRHITQH